MSGMKIAAIIFGVLLIIGGVYCLMYPVATFGALGWLIAIAMFVEGVGSALTWKERRRYGLADGWTLAGAIVSILLGIGVLCSVAMQMALDTFLAYLIAAWLVFGGIARIMGGIKLNSIRSWGVRVKVQNWWLLVVAGILLVIMGIVCFIHPMIAMASVGMIMGVFAR